MKIKFIGATKSVTGSCYFLTFNINGALKYALVDCGMYQGDSETDRKNYTDFPFDPSKLDYVFLTHVHIDHSGLIPKLVKSGFNGKIVTTDATADLATIMLLDSARIQESETERYNRRRLHEGKTLKEPLYTEDDAKAALKFFAPVKYNQVFSPYAGVELTFHDSGHVLGSAFLKFKIKEDGESFTVVFSGDVGNAPVPILKDPETIGESDYVIMESTYGDRVRENDGERSNQLAEAVKAAINAGGKVIIPSFAVGRTQELIYEIHQLRDKKMIPEVPVYIDSPMACSATEVFRKHAECFDQEMMNYLNSSDDPFNFSNIFYSSTPDQSRAINVINEPQVIIASSGMANNGRILHHLKYNIFKKECTILFVGYQAVGTLGRLISDGEKNVMIMGNKYAVNASIKMIHGYSSHADQKGLLNWLNTASQKPRNVFLMHGEENSKKILQGKLSENAVASVIPDEFDEYEIVSSKVFRQTCDGRALKPLVDPGAEKLFARQAAKVEAVQGHRGSVMEVPLKMVEPLAPVDDNMIEKLSKRDMLKILKEFRSQLQSMASKIDNIIFKVKKQ
ncbi:MAG: MBL fold metallo-hydrolase [Candidatus Wallbacteria bacterium]